MNDTRCDTCQGAGYRVGRAGELARAEICECHDRCVLCRGDRFRIEMRDGYEVAVPCTCTQAFRRVRAFNDARIPAAYGHKLLAGAADDAAGFRDRGISALARAKLLVNRYQQLQLDAGDDGAAPRGLVLVGGPGLGKTHLVCALLRYLTLERGVGCRFVDYYQLLAHIRSTFDGQGHETEATILAPLVEIPVLVLDDLGKGQATPWEWTIVDQLITRRYNAGRVVLATTNYPLAEELERRRQIVGGAGGGGGRRAGRDAEALEDRIGERLVSRLRETAEFALLEGADYRLALGASPRAPR